MSQGRRGGVDVVYVAFQSVHHSLWGQIGSELTVWMVGDSLSHKYKVLDLMPETENASRP